MKKVDTNDLFIKIPKQLMIAIANNVGGAQSTMLLVYLVVVDRFSNKEGATRVCYDDNKRIGTRSGLSKNCVDRALQWLIKQEFLVAQYIVKVSDSKGTKEVPFKTSGAAFQAHKNYNRLGVMAELSGRRLLPPSGLPTIETLGLKLVSKNHGIYESGSTKKPTDVIKENTGVNELSPDGSNFEPTEVQNRGTKLDPLSEIDLKADNSNEISFNETTLVNNNNNHHSGDHQATEETQTHNSRNGSGSPLLDPEFMTSAIALKTLTVAGFKGTAVTTLRKSVVAPLLSQITGDHFNHVLRCCREHGDVPDWIINLALDYVDEIDGINEELLKFQ